MKKDIDEKESYSKSLNRYVLGIKGFNKKYALVFICILLFLLGLFSIKESEQDFNATDTEKRLAAIIKMTEGVNNAEVMITYDTKSNKADTSFFNIDGLKNDLDRSITGVVVVADNADDYMTKINIITIVKTALNVPAGKIEVVNMKEGKQ